jgi:hypothetical protein
MRALMCKEVSKSVPFIIVAAQTEVFELYKVASC